MMSVEMCIKMELELNEPPEKLSDGFFMLQTGYVLISAHEQRIYSYNSIISMKEEWPRSQRISQALIAATSTWFCWVWFFFSLTF